MSDADAAVEALARIIMGAGTPCEGSISDAESILDALPALLRADGPAGDALRARLGFQRTVIIRGGLRETRLQSLDWEREPLP